MKVYVLVSKDKNGEPTLRMPVEYGRTIRAYRSAGRARAYAKRFDVEVVELDVRDGVLV